MISVANSVLPAPRMCLGIGSHAMPRADGVEFM
jgi:hypothetical protein